jgi:hypothetical protein
MAAGQRLGITLLILRSSNSSIMVDSVRRSLAAQHATTIFLPAFRGLPADLDLNQIAKLDSLDFRSY